MCMNFIRTRHPAAHTRTQSAHTNSLARNFAHFSSTCVRGTSLYAVWMILNVYFCLRYILIQWTRDCCIDFRLIATADTVIIGGKWAIYVGKNILRTKKLSMEHSSSMSHKVLLWKESHLHKARTQFTTQSNKRKKKTKVLSSSDPVPI